MPIIKELDNSTVDKDEILTVHLNHRRKILGRTLDTEEINRITRYINYLFNSFVTRSFLAYESDELVGWLGAAEAYPPTMVIYEYHPIVYTDTNREQIAQELIHKSIEYSKKKKIENIRTFIDVTPENESSFIDLKQHFLQVGMRQTHTVLCMENNLSVEKLKRIELDESYHIESLGAQNKELVMECYRRIFAQSYDNFTNSLSDEEQKYWNLPMRGENNDAAIVIKKGDELVALINVVEYRKFMEIGPVGVVPEHRGKKLGKVLMEECCSRLIKQGKLETYLEVDQTNTPAINLYIDYGFCEVSKKHGFLFRI